MNVFLLILMHFECHRFKQVLHKFESKDGGLTVQQLGWSRTGLSVQCRVTTKEVYWESVHASLNPLVVKKWTVKSVNKEKYSGEEGSPE